MTLHIIHSNKVEQLHDELCHLLKTKPLSNPFDVETIVCPSKAMSRWINSRFAQKMGIAAHYEYPMPSSWIWQIASQCLPNMPDKDPLQRDLMAWKVFHLLETIDDQTLFKTIHHYLKNDIDSTKRWSLAKKIASVFERYQHFRPDQIQQWKEGRIDEWQGQLWHSLTKNTVTDRVQLLINLGRTLTNNAHIKNLPQRVTFFSVTALPPLLFKNIQALAKHIDVYFFVLSPSPHYWSDFISLKQQAKQRLKSPELNDYFTTGHELLASWGRQGQVFQDMLLYELDDSMTEHYDVYDDQFSTRSQKTSLLNQLQLSLFNLNDHVDTVELDDSIRFNQCHSPLRECEVLHDQCLSLLQNKELTPEDILVIVPNMEQYAVSIEAVFKKTSDQQHVKPFIPWNLSDSSLQADNPLIRTFLNALSLPSSRFTASDILALLDCPELLQHFQFKRSDPSIIRDYINKAHVHWGFDSEHKNDLNIPNTEQNTWHQAQQRFYNFYAIDESSLQNGIAPLTGFSSSRASVIAQLLHLLDTLNEWRHKLVYARSVLQWQRDLNQFLDVLFGSVEDNGSIQVIRDALDDLALQSKNDDANKQPVLHRELIHRWLSDHFADNQSHQRFFTGGITFCSMRPMRSVPFKVIVMLGMNEHDFPRHNTPIEFDLMASKWQPGDLLISDEDRYLFLEALLCVRQTLIISYCAKSLKDNSDKEPSHLVSELRDYLDSHFSCESSLSLTMSQQISQVYAMHAFSTKNYGHEYQSYNQYWGEVAQLLTSPNSISEDKQISDVPNSERLLEVDLKQLVTCLKDPLKFYFKSQLNISLYQQKETVDDEPFSLDALQKWSLKDQLIKAQLQHEAHSLLSINAQAILPHGIHAKTTLDEIESELDGQYDGLNDYLKHMPEAQIIDLVLANDCHITGQVMAHPNLGQLLITPSNFGAKPFIECWFNHCALAATQHASTTQTSLLRCKDKSITFKPLKTEDAKKYLQQSIEVMQLAMQIPLTLIPKCSFAFQYQLLINDEKKAHSEALLKWHGNPQNEASLGEKENDLIKLTFQAFAENPSDLFNSDLFKEHAQLLYATAFKYCQFEDQA